MLACAKFIHYRRHWLCRAMHGKGRNTHGKAFAVRRRTAKAARRSLARQRVLCRAPLQTRTAKPLPCGLTFAVRCRSLPCNRLCRALSRTAVQNICRASLNATHGNTHYFAVRLPAAAHGKERTFAVRHSSTRTAKHFSGIPRPAPGISFAVRMLQFIIVI